MEADEGDVTDTSGSEWSVPELPDFLAMHDANEQEAALQPGWDGKVHRLVKLVVAQEKGRG